MCKVHWLSKLISIVYSVNTLSMMEYRRKTSSFFSSAPLTLDECHAWFHLYGLHRSVSTMKQAKNSKWKYVSPPGIEPAIPCFPARRSNAHFGYWTLIKSNLGHERFNFLTTGNMGWRMRARYNFQTFWQTFKSLDFKLSRSKIGLM